MIDALSTYGYSVLAGICGGLCFTSLYLFGLRRGLRRLAVRVGDLEDRYMSLNNKKSARARWDQEEWEKRALQTAQAAPKKYDNDPMEF